MSTHRVSPGAGWQSSKHLPKGPNGRALCRRCETEVPKGRRTFCSEGCVHEWRVRTDPGYVRQCLFRLERGVCRSCACDTMELLNQMLYARKLGIWDRPNQIWIDPTLEVREACAQWLQELETLGFDRHASTHWQADHIVPVVEGGGECGLEGFQTLCTACHKRETAALRKRLAKPKLENPRKPVEQLTFGEGL